MDNVTYSSLVEAHQDLLRKGYDRNYNVLSAEKMEDDKGHTYSANQLSIDEFYRFEGESDPGDNSIIYAVKANDGSKGTLVDTYGAQGSMNVAQFVLKVEERMQNLLSNQYNLLKSKAINFTSKEEKLLIGLAVGTLVGTIVGVLLSTKSKNPKQNSLIKHLKEIATELGEKGTSKAKFLVKDYVHGF